jgi:hypothetical protein
MLFNNFFLNLHIEIKHHFMAYLELCLTKKMNFFKL